jgi:hypothetical protein
VPAQNLTDRGRCAARDRAGSPVLINSEAG